MPEVNELFSGWSEYPPTNILVKALVEGFGGVAWGNKASTDENFDLSREANEAMQRSAVGAIASKADPKWLPVTRGKDIGLPQNTPVFAVDELKRRNLEALKQRVRRRSSVSV